MVDKIVKEMYFAVNKETGELFNPHNFYKNKISWAKLSHLKSIFTRDKLNINDYNIYKIEVVNGIPLLNSFREEI